MAANKVIVFGPTGNVGAIAASTAAKQGAKVYLAMRDTKKSIPGLSSEAEKQGDYERIQADLTKPDTVAEAIRTSGAKRAFIYLVFGRPDHMKATLEALKSVGVEFVVFLSSFSVASEKTPEDIPADRMIDYAHAQVEINLKAIFGEKWYAAVRPGAFATNAPEWWGPGIKRGEVKMFNQNYELDWVTPQDMGVVSGSILASGLKGDDSNIVYVFGPERLPMKKAFEILVKEVADKEVKLTPCDQKTEEEELVGNGLPPSVAKWLMDHWARFPNPGDTDITDELHQAGTESVVKYSGKSGVTLQEWARENKSLFA